MPFRNDEFLRKSKVTVFYNPVTKRFLDYVKVNPYDNVSGYTRNEQYMVPWKFDVGLTDKLDPVFEVAIEYSSGEQDGQNVHKIQQGI